MAVGVATETVVTNGMAAPIGMAVFPAVETIDAEGIADQPDIAGSEIEILVTHEADVFVTIPDVIVRNGHHRWCDNHRRWCHHHGRRIGDHWRYERYPARLNDTAGHQDNPSCRQ